MRVEREGRGIEVDEPVEVGLASREEVVDCGEDGRTANLLESARKDERGKRERTHEARLRSCP